MEAIKTLRACFKPFFKIASQAINHVKEIGSAVVSASLKLGALISILDLAPQKPNIVHEKFQIFQTNTSSEEVVADAFENVFTIFRTLTVYVALAALNLSVLPHHESLTEMPLEQ